MQLLLDILNTRRWNAEVQRCHSPRVLQVNESTNTTAASQTYNFFPLLRHSKLSITICWMNESINEHSQILKNSSL